MKDLEKRIGRDINQATRYAEGLDASVTKLKEEIAQLQKSILLVAEKLAVKSEDAADAHEYVKYLQNSGNK